jgi:hypothetical protein
MGIDKGNTNANVIYYDSVYGIHYPGISGQEGGGNEVHLLYEVQATPSIVVITPDHLIAYNQIWPPTETNVTDSVQAAGGIFLQCTTHLSEVNKDEIISVSPNPVADYATINLNQANGRKTEIKIFNVFGMMVWESGSIYQSGNTVLKADLSKEREGCYIIRAISDDQVLVTKKIVVLH